VTAFVAQQHPAVCAEHCFDFSLPDFSDHRLSPAAIVDTN
jgi:hypothetical protein